MNDLDYDEQISILGLTISITTFKNDNFTGEIFYYNSQNRILILKEKNEKNVDSEKFLFRYVNTRYVKEFKIISTKDINEIKLSLHSKPLDIDEILKKEYNILENERKNKEKINKSVSEPVQKLFNEISKTYNAKWEGDIIVLQDIDVRVKEPYNSEDCEGKDGKSVERIKIMISRAWERIKNSSK